MLELDSLGRYPELSVPTSRVLAFHDLGAAYVMPINLPEKSAYLTTTWAFLPSNTDAAPWFAPLHV